MMSALMGVTVLVTLYSLWVRRHTWWSRWEIGVTLALALETIGLALMSPWVSETLGPLMYRATGIWNLQQLAGHLCFVIAIAANAYHVLARVASLDQMRPWFRHRVVRPVQFAMVAMVALFPAAASGYSADGFATVDSNHWHAAYWAVVSSTLIYLGIVATRLLLISRADPRAKETVELYTLSSAFGLAAMLVQLSTTWIHADLSTLVWLCVCAAICIFAYGSARSWQAKAAWFSSSERPVAQPKPPQALS
ncbi:hypothetical protein AWC02_14135 [Mycolicibacter engbaekii]|uniref:GP55 protein n=1 Tax=Mycolicibacter engbaekii TaxID=188915 RepID=A0A1X1TKE9_9MYCO|nr:hypothetical protein [Mycolicibacter engbaekii]ORV45061.1 hypothetical protein AWC02_14135 [Mycolicibacter engbaekii]